MSRFALIVCAGLLAIVGYGCFPVGGSAAIKAVPAVCSSRGITDGAHFVSTQKVQYLYGSSNVSSPYASPTGYGPVGPPYSDDLIAAFDNAPDFFQAQLCTLDRVFISLGSCPSTSSDCLNGAWGFRKPLAGGLSQKFVAIPAGLWPVQSINGGNAWASTYHGYETVILQRMLGWNAPYFESAVPDDHPTTVLAALAHEVGHIAWYDKFVATPGSGVHDLKKFCNGDFFDAWQGGWGHVARPPIWRDLLTATARRQGGLGYPKHRDPPQIKDIDNAIARGRLDAPNGAAALLDSIYQPAAPWASFFGAIAPDEDFIETYKLFVLVNATPRLTQLKLVIPATVPYREDVIAKLASGQPLAARMQCFAASP